MCASSSLSRSLRAGTVLVSQPDQYDHFFHEAVVLVCEHSEHGSRGVLLNRETPFTMGEMASGMGCFDEHSVHRGGNGGADTVLMLHARADVAGSKPIGSSGLYLGGLRHAQQLVADGLAEPSEFKFFFNSEVWAPGALEQQLRTLWWVTNDFGASEVVAAKGDRSLHAVLRKRLAAT
ncbi:hypothetical protein KFE25_006380 [Diacronema lutheri]|uniref:Uncharacterized protein n=2 Tax=Diacronema lutheri TaxID=2081491 RepID=A0A8J6CH84_DIALT|nr:hypothetical protein KFE25_006380 [Diacronema lutheri]